MQASSFPSDRGLYLITDLGVCGGVEDALVARLSVAMQGGVDAVQLRETHLGDSDYIRLAERILAIKPPQTKFIVNRRFHLVDKIGADGVHIGGGDVSNICTIRSVIPEEAVIGVSCHSHDEVQAAKDEGADFVTLSPLFPTQSKPNITEFLSIPAFKEIRRAAGMPVYALGGIGTEQVRQLAEQDVRSIACIRGVLGNDENTIPDVVAEIHQILGVPSA